MDRVRDYRGDNGQIKNGDGCNEAIVSIKFVSLWVFFVLFFLHVEAVCITCRVSG